jgi:predicted TIM-barrel fold metal-dependent hydrolase
MRGLIKSLHGLIIVLLLGVAPFHLQGQTAPAAGTPQEKDTLLLRDYHPQSTLHVPVHNIQRARFPVFDVHTHVNDASPRERVPAVKVVEAMDHCNVEKVVILTGGWGDALQKVLDEMVKPYPDRFLVFTQIDWSKIDAPEFSQLMVKQIDDAVARGARGLKILKDFGLIDRYRSGKLVAVDDPRLDPIWKECARLGIPVAWHIADPEAFFRPLDGSNERYEGLIADPTFRFNGPQYPSQVSLLEAQQRVFARHPNTMFIALHFDWPENLDYVSDVLNRCPNVVVEFGARENELGRQPHRARRFFMQFQDRILFGTDGLVTEAEYRNYFRWLETADDSFDYYGYYPIMGRWEIYGLDLPDPILEKIYHLNADRIFSQFKGRAARTGP